MKYIRALYFIAIGFGIGSALLGVWSKDANTVVLAVSLLFLLISASIQGD